MRRLTDWTYRRLWKHVRHPYQTLRLRLAELVGPGVAVLDADRGYTEPTLPELKGRGARLVSFEVVPMAGGDRELERITADLARIPLADANFDLVCSRSVMEHVVDPYAVHGEAMRLPKPSGRWLFLTANPWDYVSLASRAIPNRLHGRIVRAMEARAEMDVFPTAYRTNDRAQGERHAARAGFRLDRFDYLSQYPSMFMWNGFAFLFASLYERSVMRAQTLRGLRGWLLVELVKPASGDTAAASARARAA